MSVNEFGGSWSNTKNSVVERYLDAYTTALHRQFNLTYFDACAGSGWRRTTRLTVGQSEFPLGRSADVQGSALRALQLPVPFRRYIFNEPNEAHRAALQRTCTDCIEQRFGRTPPQVEYVGYDVNDALRKYRSSLAHLIHRIYPTYV